MTEQSVAKSVEKKARRMAKSAIEQSAKDIINKLDIVATTGDLPECYRGDAGSFLFDLGMDIPWSRPDGVAVVEIIMREGKAAMAKFQETFEYDVAREFHDWLEDEQDD